MVILVERLSKFYSKLENQHNNNRQEVLSASLEAFRSDVSAFLNHLLLISEPGSAFLSFPWIQHCFELLPAIDRAFAKLVVNIDYPMSKWEISCVESYLDYSFRLLELLNFINSSVSRLGQSRLSLSHALCLWENSSSLAIKHLKPVELADSSKVLEATERRGEEREAKFSGKAKIIHEALSEFQSIGFWVCVVVSSVLSGNAKPYSEIKRPVSGFSGSLLVDLDSRISEAILKENGALKEVKELNEAVTSLASGERSREAAKELRRRLEDFEKILDGLRTGVDHLFSKVLAGRNELLDGIRLYKK